MTWIDISLPLDANLPVWPGDPAVAIGLAASMARGDACNVTQLSLGAHTGTHVDAPRHFIDDGPGVESLDPGTLMGPCRVLEHRDPGHVTRNDLAGALDDRVERLLIRTANSLHWPSARGSFRREFIALAPDAARYLVERGVKLVGIDYLSIEAFVKDPAHPVHTALLAAGVVILEGLDLSAVAPGDYELICLPLLIPGADGAPARAFLRRRS